MSPPCSFMASSHNNRILFTDFWDTAGQEAFNRMHPSYYYRSHCCILVFDVTRKITYQHLSDWYKELREHCPNVPCVLVANKIDVDYNVSCGRPYDLVRPIFLQLHQIGGDQRGFYRSCVGTGDEERVQVRCKAQPAVLLCICRRWHQHRKGNTLIEFPVDCYSCLQMLFLPEYAVWHCFKRGHLYPAT
jgi:hypothetical protein